MRVKHQNVLYRQENAGVRELLHETNGANFSAAERGDRLFKGIPELTVT